MNAKHSHIPLLILVSFFLWSPRGEAQDIAPSGTNEYPSDDRLDVLEQTLEAQQRRIDVLEQKEAESTRMNAEQKAETARIKAELEDTQDTVQMLTAHDTTDDQRLSIYGFFDTTFVKSFYDKDNSILKTQNPAFGTFMMNNVNLFFKSEMTDSLEAMVEAGLSFSPLGYETNLPIDAYVDGTLVPSLVDDTEYERVDTAVRGGIASQSLRYGSISIIRAYLDWKPRDWFNLRVGQYLTPYGIWNEEHASTVLVGVFYPNMMNWDLLPKTQLGLQALGSVFPADNLQIKYAVTLSNGRGPTDTVMDLDENKAVGLRTQGILSGNNWKITAGGYGYYGKYTDVTRRAEAYLNADLSQDLSSGSPIGGAIQVTEKYQEWIGAADLALELYGVRLFGEYVYRRVSYLTHPVTFSDYEFVQNGDIINRLAASYLAQSVYGILAWTLPLDKFIGQVQITPYAGYDWVTPNNSFDWFYQKSARFGLNVRPSPFVAIKTEVILDAWDDLIGGKMTSLAAQMAVSF